MPPLNFDDVQPEKACEPMPVYARSMLAYPRDSGTSYDPRQSVTWQPVVAMGIRPCPASPDSWR
jgi:hypothetical protein